MRKRNELIGIELKTTNHLFPILQQQQQQTTKGLY